MGVFDKFNSMFKKEAAPRDAKSAVTRSKKRLDVDRRFEKLKEAVSGTMSNFYMARDRETRKIVGLKVGDREKVELFEQRFRGLNKPTEGEIASQFHSDLIVETYEHGITTDGLPYMVMDFLPGPGLHKLVYARDGILDGNRLALIRQMAESLDIVHKKEFIHRDVCPRNFICAEDGKSLKLIDFGLTLPATKDFMQPGNRTGTPLYMAPEVIRRRWTDQRLDIFAFGVTAYHVLTLELPWHVSETSGLAALAHDTTPPTDVLEVRPQTDKRLATAIMKCMAPNPEDRTQTMEAFLEQIRGVEFEDEGAE